MADTPFVQYGAGTSPEWIAEQERIRSSNQAANAAAAALALASLNREGAVPKAQAEALAEAAASNLRAADTTYQRTGVTTTIEARELLTDVYGRQDFSKQRELETQYSQSRFNIVGTSGTLQRTSQGQYTYISGESSMVGKVFVADAIAKVADATQKATQIKVDQLVGREGEGVGTVETPKSGFGWLESGFDFLSKSLFSGFGGNMFSSFSSMAGKATGAGTGIITTEKFSVSPMEKIATAYANVYRGGTIEESFRSSANRAAYGGGVAESVSKEEYSVPESPALSLVGSGLSVFSDVKNAVTFENLAKTAEGIYASPINQMARISPIVATGEDVLGKVVTTGKAMGIGIELNKQTSELNTMYEGFQKEGLISTDVTGKSVFSGTPQQYQEFTQRQANVEALQAAYGQTTREVAGTGALVTTPVYEAAKNIAQFYNTNVAKPYGELISPLTTSPAAQTFENVYNENRGVIAASLGAVFPVVAPQVVMNVPWLPETPSKLSSAATALVESPAQVAEFAGMAVVGGEVLARNPLSIPALALAGGAMQIEGVRQGLTGNPTGFIYSQLGMIGITEGFGRVVGEASPIGFGKASFGTFEKGVVNDYYMAYAKLPLSGEERGGISLGGIANIEGRTRGFVGSPVDLMGTTEINVETPYSVSSTWNRAQYVAMNRFIESYGSEEAFSMWRTTGQAISAARRGYSPVQQELLGEYPIPSASRGTMGALFRDYQTYGRDVVIGGSRTIRAWVGEAGRAESLADVDIWVRTGKAEQMYRESMGIVRGEFPEATGFIRPEEGRFQITTIGEKFLGAHSIEEFPYVVENTMRMKTVGGAEIFAPSPFASFRMKASGMFSAIRYRPGEGVGFEVGRAKDIVDAYSLSRRISAWTREQAPTFDVLGLRGRASTRRAATLEEFSNLARDYARGLPEPARGEVAAMFSEMKTDPLRGLKRDVVAKYDIATGRGLMEGTPEMEAGTLFLGRKGQGAREEAGILRDVEAERRINTFVRGEREYPSGRKGRGAEVAYPGLRGTGVSLRGAGMLYPSRDGTRESIYPVAVSPSVEYSASVEEYAATALETPTTRPATSIYPTGPVSSPEVYPTITPYPRAPVAVSPPGTSLFGAELFKVATRRPTEFPTLFSSSMKREKSRRKRKRKAEEWYIWNPVPLYESVFGLYTKSPWGGFIRPRSLQYKPPKYNRPPIVYGNKQRFFDWKW